MFRADPDTVHSLIVWDGISHDGLSWLGDWLSTQDNWLLSLFPFHFGGYLIFGAIPEVAVVGGWIIFALSALLAGVLAWQMGARRAAPLVSLVLLFSGRYVHAGGFASYAAAHNITNLYGLAAMALILHWVEHRGDWKLLVLAWLLIAGGVSDPWMVAAYQLPIALAALAAAISPGLRADAVKIGLVAALSIVAVKTRLFGAMGFLPQMHYELGDWQTIVNNIGWAVRNFGGMFSVVPHTSSAETTAWGPAIISLVLVAVVFATLVANAIRRRESWGTPALAFAGIASLSAGGVVAAYVIGSVPADIASARFLLNDYYLLIVAVGVLLERQWRTLPRVVSWSAAGLAVLFVITGALTSLEVWQRPGFHLDNTRSRQLIDFLRRNELSDGYGPYWGAYANAVTAESGFAIRLRPVVFDRASGEMIAGTRAQTSRRWYRADASGTGTHFVMVMADGEECPAPAVCIAGLRRQFGPPMRELQYQQATVLVWDHALVGYQP